MDEKDVNSFDEEIRDINTIFRSRYHGATNIKGIRFQILYSILKSFDLYNNEIEHLTLEGIEDLDLIGLNLADEYIQVKTSKNTWHWNKLKDIIPNFLEVYRADSNCRFTIVIGAEVQDDVNRLKEFNKLSPKEAKRIKNKFFKLFNGLKASKGESEYILNNLTILTLSERFILQQIKLKLVERFNVGSELLEIYLSVFVSKFLNWAKDRSSIDHVDIENIKIEIGENLSRESEYQAYGKGLIEKISWKPDNKIEDFYEGKGTRSGHIVCNVDYKREFWLKKIGEALDSSKVCIIKSSSGQGKSALLYRYAYENWASNSFIIRKIDSTDDVQHILNYLKFRVTLGLPMIVLIDDIDWQKRLWASLVNECAALGIYVLVTIRNEDWFRFSKENLSTYEIIEPILNITEAKKIFEVFKSQNKVYKLVISAEWAYEKIDEPKLLIEFIYFITHGKMLEERLRDQIKEISRRGKINLK